MLAGAKAHGRLPKEDGEILQSKSQTQELQVKRPSLKKAPASKEEPYTWKTRTQLGGPLHNISRRQTGQLRTPDRGGKSSASRLES